jgi:hypothetical protein
VREDLAPIPVETPLSEEEIDLFGEYRFLVPIFVQGTRMLVPEKNSVLRALQYLDLRERTVRMDWGRYCWNDTKGCCEMTFRRPGTDPSKGRACLVTVEPGLEIIELPAGGRLCR